MLVQIAQYNLFQQYHDISPGKHSPPIPTVPITSAVSARLQRNICYQRKYMQDSYPASEQDIRATASAILVAAQQLDSSTHAQSIWAHDTSITDSTTRKYVIKRNHAGFARKVIRITVQLSNWQTTPSLQSLLQLSRHSSIQSRPHSTDNVVRQEHQSGNRSETPATSNTHSTTLHTPHSSQIASTVQPEATVSHNTFHSAIPAEEDVPSAASTQGSTEDSSNQASVPEDNTMQSTQQQPLDILHDAQQLLKAAERMLLESCGEDWLLQPLIPDMGTGEYRYSHYQDKGVACWMLPPSSTKICYITP